MTSGKGDGCVCPSDLFECDDTLGCVCPEGVDCGIEGGREVLINKLNQEELSGSTVSSQGSGAVIAVVVVSLLVLCSVIACVIVVYYRWEVIIVCCHCC